ncbi:MAG: hypothetical protein SFX18_13240 [Pirellulales bacterium]|nr:hypothetical protein [Pirellulales bacterium]
MSPSAMVLPNNVALPGDGPNATQTNITDQPRQTDQQTTSGITMQGNSHWPCLVMSHDERLSTEFAAGAKRAGWQPWITRDAVGALKILCRNPVRMAFLHLPGEDSAASGVRQLVEHMTWIGGVLLIVGASQSDPQIELWARQAGVWTYLSEVDLQANYTELCEQALQIAARHSPTTV